MGQADMFDRVPDGFFSDKGLKHKGSRTVARIALMSEHPRAEKKSWRTRIRKMSEDDMLAEYRRWRKSVASKDIG